MKKLSCGMLIPKLDLLMVSIEDSLLDQHLSHDVGSKLKLLVPSLLGLVCLIMSLLKYGTYLILIGMVNYHWKNSL